MQGVFSLRFYNAGHFFTTFLHCRVFFRCAFCAMPRFCVVYFVLCRVFTPPLCVMLRFCVMRAFVGTYGNLWELIGGGGGGGGGGKGGVWEHMGTYGNLWELMGTCGNLWELMGTYGNLWDLMGTCGIFVFLMLTCLFRMCRESVYSMK